MSMLEIELKELEQFDQIGRNQVFHSIYQTVHGYSEKFVVLISKGSKSLIADYLEYCESNHNNQILTDLHRLISIPVFRYRESVLDCLISLQSGLTTEFLFQLYPRSSSQMRKKILQTLSFLPLEDPNDILWENLNKSEPETLLLSLSLLEKCNLNERIGDIEKLLVHPISSVRNKTINILINQIGQKWLSEKITDLKTLDPIQQEDILSACLRHSDFIKLNEILHDDLSDQWIHNLLEKWSRSDFYEDQVSVLAIISKERPKASIAAFNWLMEQNLSLNLGIKIVDLCFEKDSYIFHSSLIKLLQKLPLDNYFHHWIKLHKTSESDILNRHFINQLKLYSENETVEMYLQEKLSSDKIDDIVLGLECLKTHQIPESFLNANPYTLDTRIQKLINIHETKKQNDQIEQQIELANIKITQGEIPEAHWILEELFSTASQNPRYLYLFAQAKLELKDHSEAKKLLHRSLQINSSQLDVRKTLAKAELDTGNNRTALSLILDCLQKQNNDVNLKAWLFEAYGKANELEAAYSSFFDIPQSVLTLKHWEDFLKFCFMLKKYKAVLQHYQTYLMTLEDKLPNYYTQTYYAMALYLSQNSKEFESEITSLQSRFDEHENALKAWKLMDQVCNIEVVKKYYLEQRVKLYPNSAIAHQEWLEFNLVQNPEKILEIEDLNSSFSGRKMKSKALCQLGRYDESIELLERLYLEDSSDESIPWELGINWFNANRHSKAIKYFQFYEHHRYPPEGLGYYLAVCYLREGRIEQANASLGYGLEERPYHQPSWLLLLDLAERNKLSEILQDYLVQIPEALHDNEEGLLRYINILSGNNDKLALELYTKILDENPEHYEANLGLANIFLNLGKYSKAYHHFHIIRNDLKLEWFEKYSKAAEQTLNYSEAFRLFTQLCHDQTKFENLKIKLSQLISNKAAFYAIQSKWKWEDFEAHWVVLSKFPLLHYKLGVLRLKQGKYNLSKKHLDFLRAHHGHFMRTDYFLAKISLHEKDFNEARLYLEDALLHADPKPLQIHNLLATIYLKRNNIELAKKSLLKLYTNPSTKLSAIQSLYEIYSSENRLENFMALIEEEVQRSDSPIIRKYYGLCLYKTRQFSKSCDYLENLEDLEAKFYYGLGLNQTNCFELAAQNFKSLDKHSHKFEGFHYHYGITLVELNRFQAASKQFRYSIELNEQVWSSRCELVRIQLKCLNPQRAMEDFQSAMNEKFDLELCYEMVKLCFQQELHESALEIFQLNCNELLLQAEPELFNKLCQAFLLSSQALSETEQSLEILQVFHRKDPDGLRHFLCNNDVHSQIRLTLLTLAHKQFAVLSYPSLEIAKIAYEHENWDLALQWFNQSEIRHQRTELTSKELFILAHHTSEILYKTGDLENCKIYVNKALQIIPENIEMLEKMSFLNGRENKAREQAKIDQKLFFLKKDNAKVSERLIDWFISDENFQNAIFHLKNYLKSYPTDLHRLKQLAEIANKSGMYALELSALGGLEELGECFANDHHLRVGRACLALGQQERAAMSFQKHLSKNPESSGLRFQLAKLYKDQGFLKKSRLTLIEILRQEPGNHIVRYELAETLFEENNYERCLNTLEDLFRIKPFHTEGKELMAKVYYTQGRNNLAMKALEQVLQNTPDNPNALLMQARIYRSEEIHEEASKCYEKLYRITKNEEYLLEMSLLNIKLGRNSTAKKQLQQLTRETEVNGKLYKIARNLLRQHA